MTTLYYHTGACSLGPHIVLDWIGAPYTAQKVEFGSPELLKANPQGAVPVLIEDDGWTLTQAGAIVHYLARKHPEAGLGGEDTPRGQAELDRWSSFLTGDLHPPFGGFFSPKRYSENHSDAALNSVREACKKLAGKRLQFLDENLQGKDYVLGKRSVIDAYAFPMLSWATKVLDGGLDPYPNVKALFERVQADPAVQKVLAAENAK